MSNDVFKQTYWYLDRKVILDFHNKNQMRIHADDNKEEMDFLLYLNKCHSLFDSWFLEAYVNLSHSFNYNKKVVDTWQYYFHFFFQKNWNKSLYFKA